MPVDLEDIHMVIEKALIDRIGPSDANVLITGENGTGKGVVTQALHAVSARATKPLFCRISRLETALSG